MPFTFAHPAIVLPLAKLPKRLISTTGLIIGSMAPDFEYFLRMEATSEYGHTIPGTFYFSLPLALAVSFVFHQVIRNPLIDHLPDELFYRFCRFKSFNWPEYVRKHLLSVVVSIIMGALSHIFWDSFTFADGFFAQLFDLHRLSVFSYPSYRIMQHGGTLIGFAYMGWVILRMEKTPGNRSNSFSWNYWLLVGVTILVIWVTRVIIDDPSNRKEAVVTLINGFLLGLFVSSLISQKPGELSS